MATVITAGNATNGLSFTADNTGALEFKTGTGAGTTALTLSSSQIATFAGSVAGSTGTLYPIVSGTAVSASGTSVSFTDIPSWVKRITVMFSGVSTNGSNPILLQLGAGSLSTSGYVSQAGVIAATTAATASSTVGIYLASPTAASDNVSGMIILSLISSNTWAFTGTFYRAVTSLAVFSLAGVPFALGGALDRLRIVGSTTGSPTDTFDAGTINILYE